MLCYQSTYINAQSKVALGKYEMVLGCQWFELICYNGLSLHSMIASGLLLPQIFQASIKSLSVNRCHLQKDESEYLSHAHCEVSSEISSLHLTHDHNQWTITRQRSRGQHTVGCTLRAILGLGALPKGTSASLAWFGIRLATLPSYAYFLNHKTTAAPC